ncbi:putative reverse transcriptase domain-containing protein [Tanacetum coccineum]
MDSDNYLEGQFMQRPPLFEKTKLDEVIPFEKQSDDLKKRLAKNNEAKMVIYNALPRKEFERIFMCNTAKEMLKTLLITHQASSSNNLYVWDASSGRVRHTLTGHKDKVVVVDVSRSSSRHVVSSGYDRIIKLWDLNKGYCVNTMMHPSNCNALSFIQDGQTVRSSHVDGHLRSNALVASYRSKTARIFRIARAMAILCFCPLDNRTPLSPQLWFDEDVHDLRSVENEFPAIAFNDSLASGETQSCKPTVSSLNDEIDFRISFDDSDDEDYTVIFDKKSFLYKIISTNDLKTDSENDNEKVNMPTLPSPEPTVSYFDNLDFFKDFENEFPAIVYNVAQTSKSDLLTKPTLNPLHIDEFDLKDETSLSEYNEGEQNILYFNDLFPFNIIHLDDLKSEKDNSDYEVDIIQSSGGPREEKSMNIGGEFTNLEILKCWSLETSRWLFNTNSCSINST